MKAPSAVVIVCDGASATGGTERVAIASALGLADRGVRVGFFAAEGELDPRLVAHPGITAESLGLTDAYHTGSKKELLKRFFWNAEAGARFARFLNSFSREETLVHFQAFRRILSASAVRAARGYVRVFTLHDFGIACPNTSLYDFELERICPFRPMSPACFARQCTHSGWPMKAMQMGRATVNGPLVHVAREFDGFINVSPFSAEVVNRYLPAITPKRVIDNPVEVQRGERVRAEENREFVFVGRLQAEKGVELFARAAKQAGVPAVFIGDGSEVERIRAANPEAELTGWLSNSELAARMAGARAAVFPSKWLETAGLSTLEALARGVPVIVSDVCAAKDYVANGETGRWFTSGDEARLSEVLAQVATEDVKGMSEAAYDRYWSDPFTLDRHLDGLQAYYTELFSARLFTT